MTTTVQVTASGHDVTVTGYSPNTKEQTFSNVVKKGTTETFYAHTECSLGISEIPNEGGAVAKGGGDTGN